MNHINLVKKIKHTQYNNKIITISKMIYKPKKNNREWVLIKN